MYWLREPVFLLFCPLLIADCPLPVDYPSIALILTYTLLPAEADRTLFLINANYEKRYYSVLFFHDHQERLFRKIISKGPGE